MLKLLVNGVQINNILCRRSLLLFSTAAIPLHNPHNPLADYLVKSLGFSEEEAVSTSKQVSHLKSPERPVAVINFLKKIGLEQSQIKAILSYDAHFLATRDISKTLCPKIRAFQELGFSKSALGSVMALNPSILNRSMESYIKPLIKSLRSVLGSDEVVTKAIQRNPLLLNYGFKRLVPNSSLLRSHGISGKKLETLVLYNPWHLVCQTELLEKHLKDVQTLFGIPPESAQFLPAMFVFASLSRDTIESKIRVFRSYGWTEEEVKTIVRKLPCCLRMSESKIKIGLDFYTKELGYEISYIATHPKLLVYSMKNRILPRNRLWKALKKKKLIVTRGRLYTILGLSDALFMKKYVMPYRNELPKLCEAWIKKSSSSSIAMPQ